MCSLAHIRRSHGVHDGAETDCFLFFKLCEHNYWNRFNNTHSLLQDTFFFLVLFTAWQCCAVIGWQEGVPAHSCRSSETLWWCDMWVFQHIERGIVVNFYSTRRLMKPWHHFLYFHYQRLPRDVTCPVNCAFYLILERGDGSWSLKLQYFCTLRRWYGLFRWTLYGNH